MSKHVVSHDWLSLETLMSIITEGKKLELSATAIEAIESCKSYLDNMLASREGPIYGINTGFGSLCNTQISSDELSQLQANLVMSHACGTGELVPQDIVKIMMILKIQNMCYGHSGVQLTTVQRFVDMFNSGIIPVVYEQGSLGASGDLAPLAHLALPLLGLGEVYDQGERIDTSEVYKRKNWSALTLGAKEGLALLNGTQFMSAYGVYTLAKSETILANADKFGALALEAFDGRIEPFSDLPHLVRKQPGQLVTAQAVRRHLDGSELINQPKEHVQDPYSFRCMPQVHGASRDVIDFVKTVFEREVNSVTDNPTVFPDADEVISAGNFHGQPLAMALDQLAIALAELGSIAERRVYKLISGTRGLPAFLVANPGLNSGFMIPQYTAASIVSQNKQCCMPASVDSIDSSNGQEDHVSMGANAATKCLRVAANVQRIQGIELMNASQAMQFRDEQRTSPELRDLLTRFRKVVPLVQADRVLSPDIRNAEQFVQVVQ